MNVTEADLNADLVDEMTPLVAGHPPSKSSSLQSFRTPNRPTMSSLRYVAPGQR